MTPTRTLLLAAPILTAACLTATCGGVDVGPFGTSAATSTTDGSGGGSSSSSSTTTTAAGTGGAFSCPPGYAECVPKVCTNIAGNPLYCGGCSEDNECLLLHAENGCDAGVCFVAGCDPGWGQCVPGFSGCPTDVMSDNANCGICGTVCADGGYCNMGSCDKLPERTVTP